GNPNVDEDTTASFQILGGNTVEEGEDVFLGFDVSISNQIGKDVFFSLQNDVDDSASTPDASAGEDYFAGEFYISNGQGGFKLADVNDLKISAGDTSIQVFVKIDNDDVYEPNEVVALTATTTSELVVGDKSTTATGIITDSTDNPPKSESFTHQVSSSGMSQIIFDTAKEAIDGDNKVATDHISDAEDDADDSKHLKIIITSLPDHGTLYFFENNKWNPVESKHLNSKQFNANELNYEPDSNSEGFILGVKEAQLNEAGSSNKEFLNWGDAEGAGNTRVLDLGDGHQVTITSQGGNLVQYLGDPKEDHVGYGIGVKNDTGIDENESIAIDFGLRPAGSVTLGLDGVGGWFQEGLKPGVNTGDETSVVITVNYIDGNKTGTVTYQYQKASKGDVDLFHKITIPVTDENDSFDGTLRVVDGTLPDGVSITGVVLGTEGNGNWELRYLETEASDSFDYKAVDSDGNLSEESTVTIEEGNGDLNAVNDPAPFLVQLGSFNTNGSWQDVDGATLSAQFKEDSDRGFAYEDGDKKVGVDGKAGGYGNQIEYDRNSGESEQFIIDLDQDATTFTFAFSNLYKGEGNDGDFTDNHEQGRWIAYLDGVAVASDTFIASEGNNKGEVTVTPKVDGNAVVFDKVVFEATDYTNRPTHDNDASDFFLTGFQASSEGAYGVIQGGLLTIPTSELGLSELLDNDSDTDGDPIRITYVYGEQYGDAYVKDGVVYFDLDGSDFVGPTSFEYQITDDRGNVASAVVNVIVSPKPADVSVESVELLESEVPEGIDLAYKVSLSGSALKETDLPLLISKQIKDNQDSADDQDVDLDS
ncbi:Ig-like domain-containing protein, partial [Vibrio mexicanus]|uniref:Ig-like domain-containing protein n=1 Tax=Vibrio mexicanus TaxID=1004326 RepID=UPI000AB8B119